jgi:hypothetical protein
MKKQNTQIIVYRRNFFGILVKIAAFNKNQFEARISTSGVLRINKMYDDRGAIVAAFADGEWHYVSLFSADYQDAYK